MSGRGSGEKEEKDKMQKYQLTSYGTLFYYDSKNVFLLYQSRISRENNTSDLSRIKDTVFVSLKQKNLN